MSLRYVKCDKATSLRIKANGLNMFYVWNASSTKQRVASEVEAWIWLELKLKLNYIVYIYWPETIIRFSNCVEFNPFVNWILNYHLQCAGDYHYRNTHQKISYYYIDKCWMQTSNSSIAVICDFVLTQSFHFAFCIGCSQKCKPNRNSTDSKFKLSF